MTLACDTVVVTNLPTPTFVLSPPEVSVVAISNPQILVEITNPSELHVVPTPVLSTNIVLPVAGPVGPAGSSGPQEVFVQQSQPTEGSTAWLWAQLDDDGPTGNVMFLKAYRP